MRTYVTMSHTATGEAAMRHKPRHVQPSVDPDTVVYTCMSHAKPVTVRVPRGATEATSCPVCAAREQRRAS